MQKSQKVIVITGTSSGIGFRLANFLVSEGYQVFGLSRSVPKEAQFTTFPTDITVKDDCFVALKEIYKQSGRIDVLINNAGKGMVGPFEDAQDEEVWSLFQLNLLGTLHTIQAVMPIFRDQQSGRIINISSIGSVMGLPFRSYYSASKSALDMCTEALRYEIEPFDVDACVVHLGDIQTDIAQSRIQTEVSAPYKNVFAKVFQGIDAHVTQGKSPDEVAHYLMRLIERKSLKSHYYFGKPMQKFSIFLKKVLPQKWFEGLIKSYTGI